MKDMQWFIDNGYTYWFKYEDYSNEGMYLAVKTDHSSFISYNDEKSIYKFALLNGSYQWDIAPESQNVVGFYDFKSEEQLKDFINQETFTEADDEESESNILIDFEDYVGSFSVQELIKIATDDYGYRAYKGNLINKFLDDALNDLVRVYALCGGNIDNFYKVLQKKMHDEAREKMIESAKENMNNV